MPVQARNMGRFIMFTVASPQLARRDKPVRAS